MARPRKYHSKAERKAANRAKNKVYYERNKDDINKRRRDKRARQRARDARNQARKELRPWMRLGSSQAPGGESRSGRLFLAVERARSAFHAFKRAVDPNVREYTLSVCQRVFELSDEGDDAETARILLKGHTTKLELWKEQIMAEYDTVFTLSGVGDPLHQLDAMLKEVTMAIQAIEDLDIHLMDGFVAFENAFRERQLMMFE